MFTDETFYTGDLFIPNLGEKVSNLHFYQWLNRCEMQGLRATLGHFLTNELIEQMVFNEDQQKYVLKENADPKWDWLLNGRKYSNDDLTEQSQGSINYTEHACSCMNTDNYQWKGIVSEIDIRIRETEINGNIANGIVISTSYLAYYTYWLWSFQNETATTGTGEKALKTKGGKTIRNNHKRVNAYNSFVAWCVSCSSSGNVGLYQYMRHFANLYPEWNGEPLSYESIY